MPLLDDANVQRLLRLAAVSLPCQGCGKRKAYDYCRSCDEFYWLGCRCRHEKDHAGHRTYLVPYVEER